LYRNTTRLIALAAISFLAHAIPVHAAEETLYANGECRVFVDDQWALAATGCRMRRSRNNNPTPDQSKVVITDIGAGLRAVASVENLLVLQENQGTACPSGAWSTVVVNTGIFREIHLPDCTEISGYELKKSERRGRTVVTVTLVDVRGRRTAVDVNLD
jgi:hypothetical protein